MAICSCCEQEMTARVSCSGEAGFGPAEDIPPIPYPSDNTQSCHDCGTPPGGFHHPGCDSERCPLCEGQAISCDCQEEED